MKQFYFMILFSFLIKPNPLFSQSGTFDFFAGASQDGQSISQTISTVKLTMYSDHTTTPFPSMVLEDWSAFPPFTNNAATMNGQLKPSLTFSFDHPVRIISLLIADFDGVTNYHLKFTPSSGSIYDMTIDGYNGSVVPVNFQNITSFVVTNYSGGNICLGIDNVIMSAPLPVELSSFTAIPDGKIVNLKWVTQTELNNHGFNIQRKKQNGDWQLISFVLGNGNSNSPKSYFFTDKSPFTGKSQYRIQQVDNDGKIKFYDPVDVETKITSFELNQNFPNPFNPTTTISYSITENSNVKLTVTDLLGREVTKLVDCQQQAGLYNVKFDGTNFNSGVYFYRLKAGDYSMVKKFILVK